MERVNRVIRYINFLGLADPQVAWSNKSIYHIERIKELIRNLLISNNEIYAARQSFVPGSQESAFSQDFQAYCAALRSIGVECDQLQKDMIMSGFLYSQPVCMIENPDCQAWMEHVERVIDFDKSNYASLYVQAEAEYLAPFRSLKESHYKYFPGRAKLDNINWLRGKVEKSPLADTDFEVWIKFAQIICSDFISGYGRRLDEGQSYRDVIKTIKDMNVSVGDFLSILKQALTWIFQTNDPLTDDEKTRLALCLLRMYRELGDSTMSLWGIIEEYHLDIRPDYYSVIGYINSHHDSLYSARIFKLALESALTAPGQPSNHEDDVQLVYCLGQLKPFYFKDDPEFSLWIEQKLQMSVANFVDRAEARAQLAESGKS